MRLPIALLVVLASGLSPQGRATSTTQQTAIDAYVAERQRVRSMRDGSLEPLYAAARRVSDVFIVPEAGDRVIDELSQQEIERIRRALPGLDVHIGDTVGVQIDADHFLALAKAHGGIVDVEFFALYRRTYPRSHRAAWMERTGPETACADFTSGELVDVYRAWRRFQRAHPERYRESVARELEDAAESLLVEGNGLCPQHMTLVRRELERLLAASPDDPVAPRIRERIGRIRQQR